METCYLICAALGCTVIVLQFLASVIGFGVETDHDTATDHESDHGNSFLGMLTLRSVAAGIAFFGLAGMTALSASIPPLGTFAAASLGGFLALYAVAALMGFMKQLKHDGTAKLEDAVGLTGTVYLRIPAHNAGPGKVTLTLQNRTLECEAFTASEALATGRTVRVVALRTPESVDVESIEPSEELA